MSGDAVSYALNSREREVASAEARQQAAQVLQQTIDQTTQAQALGYATAVFCQAFLQGLREAEVPFTDRERVQVLCAALGRL